MLQKCAKFAQFSYGECQFKTIVVLLYKVVNTIELSEDNGRLRYKDITKYTAQRNDDSQPQKEQLQGSDEDSSEWTTCVERTADTIQLT